MVATVFLVALRVGIGAVFFAGALNKLDGNFTSEGFLRQAKGPLAPLYQAGLPDVHNWRKLIEQPMAAEPNPLDKKLSETPRASEEYNEVRKDWRQNNKVYYQQWEDRIIEDWGRQAQAVSNHYRFNDHQRDAVGGVLTLYEKNLKNYLADNHDTISGFRNDLYRLETKAAGLKIDDDPYIRERREEALAVRDWVAEADQKLQRDLEALATDQQQIDYHDIPPSTQNIAVVDNIVMWTHLAIGLCLIIGLFTRLAAFGAGAFLLTVAASQPPWVEGAKSWLVGPDAVMYQAIMMFACFALMGTNVGRWAGVDFLIHHILVRPWRSKENPDASK